MWEKRFHDEKSIVSLSLTTLGRPVLSGRSTTDVILEYAACDKLGLAHGNCMVWPGVDGQGCQMCVTTKGMYLEILGLQLPFI